MPISVQKNRAKAAAPVRYGLNAEPAPVEKKSLWKEEIHLSPLWSSKTKISFFNELSTLLNAGLDLHTSLKMVGDGLPERQRLSIQQTVKEFTEGVDFAAALENSGFSTFDVSLIQVGEETGQLQNVLQQLSLYYGKLESYKGQLIKAITYPAFVATFSCGVLYFLLTMLVPMFADTYARFGSELPKITQFVQKASLAMADYGPKVFILLLAASGGIYYHRSKPKVRRTIHQVGIKFPLFGSIIRALAMGRLCQTVHVLLESGVTLEKSLVLAKGSCGLYQLELSVDNAHETLIAGKGITDSLQRDPLFSNRSVALLRIGEEAGNLSQTFRNLTDHFDGEAEAKTSIIGAVLEPALILVLGLIVGIVLVAMYLPLFSLGSAI